MKDARYCGCSARDVFRKVAVIEYWDGFQSTDAIWALQRGSFNMNTTTSAGFVYRR